ncbi:MAG: hypothetical protein COA66_14710 [Arcobacter sp.]|nr:MAG: hypothetical protein COA66_14710 [Arcobacter sp.]
MVFEKYPFERLNELLEGITPNNKYDLSVLTIGEPQFETPTFIKEELNASSDLLKKYPASAGLPVLKDAMISFVQNRFNVSLKKEEIIPTLGTREVLFNFPQFLLFDVKNPVIAFPNPFYQIYEGAGIVTKSKVIHMNLTSSNEYKASLSKEEMQECDLVILNYPSNPTASTASIGELSLWVKNALEYDFVLINDECYSEIYFDESKKPCSLLEASLAVSNTSFKNILVLNSISKRSSAPGLRSGFIAGDQTILKEYMKYRTYIGCAAPVPIQMAASKAWSDEEHVRAFRGIYKENFLLAKAILGIKIPEATFYIWLKVKDELEFTKKLYQEKHIKVLPGTFLGRNGMGKGYIRIALVEKSEKTKEVLLRLRDFINESK